ncbi:MAG: glycosyltransferase family 2 protein [Candidatus Cloacimonadota bacterium]|nr:MAG: glycosyltransferase family 2 protein [Candidatus Cloacimonadota bacterium]
MISKRRSFVMDKYPHVTIIVPVLNRENTIGMCIESLLKLDYPSYEVIVVERGSTDKSRHIVSKNIRLS